MPTQYTPLLGLALPVTGELDGLWGDVVNNSITTLVEGSIAGVATASVTSGDWTLTTTGSGAANQARMAILIPTGTPGVTRNIIAPSSSKSYIVVNQSDAAVVLKGSATTGCTIGAGIRALCVWTGTDFAITASVAGPATSTNNAIPRFNGTTGNTLQNSGVTIDNDNNLTIPAQKEMRLADQDSSNYLGFKAPATVANNYVLTMPTTDGDNGQTLITDGNGVLTWGAAGGGFGNIYTIGGSIGTSVDASSWVIRTSNTLTDVYALAYNGTNLYVYGGAGGVLATSTNGAAWTIQTSGTTSNINALVYGGTSPRYIYAGAGGVLATSTDAVTWSTQTSGTSSAINALVTNNVSAYVYAGNGGVLATSTNTTSWTLQTSGTSSAIKGLAFNGATLFVYVGAGGVIGTADTSALGTWTLRTSGTTSSLNAVTFAGGKYVAVGNGGAIVYSTNAITWTTATTSISQDLNAVAYDGSVYVAMGANGVVLTSSDAITWSTGSSTFLSNINALVYGSTLVFGGNGSNVTATKGSLYLMVAPVTLTLPSNPSVGDYIGASNLSDSLTCVVNGNSQYIMGVNEAMTVDVLDAGFNMYYSGASKGWILV